jgi:hypothetical protein
MVKPGDLVRFTDEIMITTSTGPSIGCLTGHQLAVTDEVILLIISIVPSRAPRPWSWFYVLSNTGGQVCWIDAYDDWVIKV